MFVTKRLYFMISWIKNIINVATFCGIGTGIILMRLCVAIRMAMRGIMVFTICITKAYHHVFMVMMRYDSMS